MNAHPKFHSFGVAMPAGAVSRGCGGAGQDERPAAKGGRQKPREAHPLAKGRWLRPERFRLAGLGQEMARPAGIATDCGKTVTLPLPKDVSGSGFRTDAGFLGPGRSTIRPPAAVRCAGKPGAAPFFRPAPRHEAGARGGSLAA